MRYPSLLAKALKDNRSNIDQTMNIFKNFVSNNLLRDREMWSPYPDSKCVWSCLNWCVIVFIGGRLLLSTYFVCFCYFSSFFSTITFSLIAKKKIMNCPVDVKDESFSIWYNFIYVLNRNEFHEVEQLPALGMILNQLQ